MLIQRLFNFIGFLLLIFGISVLYFGWYYHHLDLSFSYRTVLFIFLYSILIYSALYISRTKIWLSIIVLVVFILSIIFIINFGYISLFHTFLPFHSGQEKHLETLLITARESYSSVPLHIYLSTLLFFTAHCLLIVSFYLNNKKKNLLAFCGNRIKSIYDKKYKVSFLSFCLSIAIIFIGTTLSQYVVENPREDWWVKNYDVSDLGMYGHIFKNVHDVFIKDIHEVETVLAFDDVLEKIEQTTSTIDIEELEEKNDIATPLDYVRLYLSELDHSYGENREGVSIPDFSSDPPNILIYQLESIGSWAINNDPSPMPFFKKLIEENIHVDKFFANACHTIDAEFATLCSFLPHSGHPISDVASENDYYCLPSFLHDNIGYNTAVFHTNSSDFWNRTTIDPKWGFNNLFFTPDNFSDFKMDDSIPLQKAVEYIKQSRDPVFAQVIGLSSHTFHTKPDLELIGEVSDMTMEYFDGHVDPELVKRTDTRDLDEEKMKMFFSYLVNVDNAIENLFSSLEKENLLDSTIVIITNDHRLYSFPEDSKENYYLYNEVPFVMYVPGMEGKIVKDIATHIDIAPSLLHLLFGDGFEIPNNFIGQSIFSSKHPNYALSACHHNVGYVTPNHIIVGNTQADTYLMLHEEEEVSTKEIQKASRGMQVITNLSDGLVEQNMLTPVF